MGLTLPGATLRAVAQSLRQLAYVPNNWQVVLGQHSPTVREQLEPLLDEMKAEGGRPKLMALLLERLADTQDALQHERDAWSFVWSGPEPLHARAADTFATVDQLLRKARCSILIATYNIGLSDEFRALMEGLARRLEAKELQRIQLFFHPVQIQDRLGHEPMTAIRSWFDKQVWPWPAKPEAYVDKRLLQARTEHCLQHAKVVIADADTPQASALVTSANFSEAAQRHNFEAGWLVREPWRADMVNKHFQQLVGAGLFVELHGRAEPANNQG
jgi:phosphatidylserine/phosphatidylglycerophosphate/cardiolipin synthase-like enzyme